MKKEEEEQQQQTPTKKNRRGGDIINLDIILFDIIYSIYSYMIL